MKRMSVKESKPGMVLAQPITDQQGRTIVNAGTKLNALYISRLEKWGITEVIVADEAAAPAADAAADPAAAPAAAAAPQPPAAAARPSLPPGVHRGPDLVARHDQMFAPVSNEPLMLALGRVVRRRLLAGR